MGAIHQTTWVWWWLQRHFPKPNDWNKSSRRCAQELNTPQLELGNFERDDMMHRRENSQQLCSRRMNIHWLHSTKQKYKKKKNKNRCFRLILNYIGIHYDDDSTGISRQAKMRMIVNKGSMSSVVSKTYSGSTINPFWGLASALTIHMISLLLVSSRNLITFDISVDSPYKQGWP